MRHFAGSFPIIYGGFRAAVSNRVSEERRMLFHDNAVRIIGTRHGEKLYETLLTREERANAVHQRHEFVVLFARCSRISNRGFWARLSKAWRSRPTWM